MEKSGVKGNSVLGMSWAGLVMCTWVGIYDVVVVRVM